MFEVLKTFTFSIIVVIFFCSFTTFAQDVKGTSAIKNVSTEMLLGVMDANKKNETPTVAYSPTNRKCMTWDFNRVEGNTYHIKNLFTNKTFQPQEAEITQQWEFLPQANNTYLIQLKGTGLCITPFDSKGAIKSKTILVFLPKKMEVSCSSGPFMSSILRCNIRTFCCT